MPPSARVAFAAIVAFLVGFAWQYLSARRLERRLDATTRELRLARLEAMLAVAVTQAQRGEYERARSQTSDFYTHAQRSVTGARVANRPNATLPAAEDALRRVLQERDTTVTLLSRGDPAAVDALTRQLTEYGTALRGPPPAERSGSAATSAPVPKS